MEIAARIIATLIMGTTLLAAAVYWSSSLVESGDLQLELIEAVLFVTIAVMAGTGLLLGKIILQPLRRLGKAADQVIRGDFAAAKIRSSKGDDELSHVALAFEIMRKKVVQMQGKDRMLKGRTLQLERANEELVEKEKVLQRAYAKLEGQRQELEKISVDLALANQEFADANEKLKKLDKMKTDFIKIAAHELRTPIQPIIGMVELAQRGLITNEQAWKTISAEATRLANVATSILDASKIEKGTLSYSMKPLGLKVLAEAIASTSSKFTNEDGSVIAIKLDLDEQDAQVLADKDRLVHAFSNIVSNAIRFAKNGTITIQTRSNDEEGLAEIRIIDDGPGIPPEILQLLFNKFITKTPENERGAGLALYITKNIIEAHGGSIKAENNSDGKGATFTVSLPLNAKKRVPSVAESG
jgi:signal transduction histidine kinase